MNWEGSILNKIYRTKDFKIGLINMNKLKDKSAYIEKMNSYLNIYNLNQDIVQIRINDNAALYKLKPNKNTFYFSFNLNSYVYLYASFFEIENNHINYSSIWESEGGSSQDLFQEKIEKNENKEKKGKAFSDVMKTFLFRFLFANEFEDFSNDVLLKEYYKKLDSHFKFRNYLICEDSRIV